ncbi:glycosyl transferase family 90-domain-containing protein [Mycena rebaudengoi]|nr:glycosyl transferase family 90-domain-containing protein [Mycena rebaudengoi]
MLGLKRFFANGYFGATREAGSYELISGDEDPNNISTTDLSWDPSVSNSSRKSWAGRHRRLLISLAIMLMSVVTLGFAAGKSFRVKPTATSAERPPIPSSSTPPMAPDPPKEEEPPDPVVIAAQLEVDALFDRQSSTLKEAAARYSLKTDRPPPRGFDKWFDFAKQKSCLIDDYDQIHRDFEPFYQLAQDDPLWFQQRLDVILDMVKNSNPRGISKMVVENGILQIPNKRPSWFWNSWPNTFRRFTASVPNMTFVVNGQDEPRVVFNYRELGAQDRAFNLTDETPFSIAPNSTSEFFNGQSGCNVLARPDGFTESANGDISFFLSSASTGFTTDLFPIFSITKISPCFSDILYPSEYYYSSSLWSPKYIYPNNIKWSDKQSKLYWRGTSSGGQLTGWDFHKFTRFKLPYFSQKHPDLADLALTTFMGENCAKPQCDEAAIKHEFNITGNKAPREDAYKYKYLLDVDGNTFSGRFLGLLRSGSLVFKMTAFEEFFNDWLRPFEHYIPVLPDLSDLVEKIEWARSHDAEARMIQERGRQATLRIMTDAQNDCYWVALLLEWAQLQEIGRNFTLNEP